MADTIIVCNIDEEDTEHNASRWEEGRAFNFPLKALRCKVIEILFQHNSAGVEIFPYEKFREFVGEVQKYLKILDQNSIPNMKFFWKTIIQWVMAIKMAFTGNVGDLKEDLKLNILLTDIIAEYVMFKCNATLMLAPNDKTQIENSANCIMRTLIMVFSRNISFIQMTMLKIAIMPKFHDILNPIFLKCKLDEEHPINEDLISYLRVIFYFRQWRNLCSTNEEKEKINTLAVGLSKKALRSSNTIDLTSETVLPKYVPPVNELNNSFQSISDLIKFAMNKGNFGTRILLINRSLNLKEAIERYFKQLERYINGLDFQSDSLDDKDFGYINSNLNNTQTSITCRNLDQRQISTLSNFDQGYENNFPKALTTEANTANLDFSRKTSLNSKAIRHLNCDNSSSNNNCNICYKTCDNNSIPKKLNISNENNETTTTSNTTNKTSNINDSTDVILLDSDSEDEEVRVLVTKKLIEQKNILLAQTPPQPIKQIPMKTAVKTATVETNKQSVESINKSNSLASISKQSCTVNRFQFSMRMPQMLSGPSKKLKDCTQGEVSSTTESDNDLEIFRNRKNGNSNLTQEVDEATSSTSSSNENLGSFLELSSQYLEIRNQAEKSTVKDDNNRRNSSYQNNDCTLNNNPKAQCTLMQDAKDITGNSSKNNKSFKETTAESLNIATNLERSKLNISTPPPSQCSSSSTNLLEKDGSNRNKSKIQLNTSKIINQNLQKQSSLQEAKMDAKAILPDSISLNSFDLTATTTNPNEKSLNLSLKSKKNTENGEETRTIINAVINNVTCISELVEGNDDNSKSSTNVSNEKTNDNGIKTTQLKNFLGNEKDDKIEFSENTKNNDLVNNKNFWLIISSSASSLSSSSNEELENQKLVFSSNSRNASTLYDRNFIATNRLKNLIDRKSVTSANFESIANNNRINYKAKNFDSELGHGFSKNNEEISNYAEECNIPNTLSKSQNENDSSNKIISKFEIQESSNSKESAWMQLQKANINPQENTVSTNEQEKLKSIHLKNVQYNIQNKNTTGWNILDRDNVSDEVAITETPITTEAENRDSLSHKEFDTSKTKIISDIKICAENKISMSDLQNSETQFILPTVSKKSNKLTETSKSILFEENSNLKNINTKDIKNRNNVENDIIESDYISDEVVITKTPIITELNNYDLSNHNEIDINKTKFSSDIKNCSEHMISMFDLRNNKTLTVLPIVAQDFDELAEASKLISFEEKTAFKDVKSSDMQNENAVGKEIVESHNITDNRVITETRVIPEFNNKDSSDHNEIAINKTKISSGIKNCAKNQNSILDLRNSEIQIVLQTEAQKLNELTEKSNLILFEEKDTSQGIKNKDNQNKNTIEKEIVENDNMSDKINTITQTPIITELNDYASSILNDIEINETQVSSYIENCAKSKTPTLDLQTEMNESYKLTDTSKSILFEENRNLKDIDCKDIQNGNTNKKNIESDSILDITETPIIIDPNNYDLSNHNEIDINKSNFSFDIKSCSKHMISMFDLGNNNTMTVLPIGAQKPNELAETSKSISFPEKGISKDVKSNHMQNENTVEKEIVENHNISDNGVLTETRVIPKFKNKDSLDYKEIDKNKAEITSDIKNCTKNKISMLDLRRSEIQIVLPTVAQKVSELTEKSNFILFEEKNASQGIRNKDIQNKNTIEKEIVENDNMSHKINTITQTPIITELNDYASSIINEIEINETQVSSYIENCAKSKTPTLDLQNSKMQTILPIETKESYELTETSKLILIEEKNTPEMKNFNILRNNPECPKFKFNGSELKSQKTQNTIVNENVQTQAQKKVAQDSSKEIIKESENPNGERSIKNVDNRIETRIMNSMIALNLEKTVKESFEKSGNLYNNLNIQINKNKEDESDISLKNNNEIENKRELGGRVIKNEKSLLAKLKCGKKINEIVDKISKKNMELKPNSVLMLNETKDDRHDINLPVTLLEKEKNHTMQNIDKLNNRLAGIADTLKNEIKIGENIPGVSLNNGSNSLNIFAVKKDKADLSKDTVKNNTKFVAIDGTLYSEEVNDKCNDKIKKAETMQVTNSKRQINANEKIEQIEKNIENFVENFIAIDVIEPKQIDSENNESNQQNEYKNEKYKKKKQHDSTGNKSNRNKNIEILKKNCISTATLLNDNERFEYNKKFQNNTDNDIISKTSTIDVLIPIKNTGKKANEAVSKAATLNFAKVDDLGIENNLKDFASCQTVNSLAEMHNICSLEGVNNKEISNQVLNLKSANDPKNCDDHKNEEIKDQIAKINISNVNEKKIEKLMFETKLLEKKQIRKNESIFEHNTKITSKSLENNVSYEKYFGNINFENDSKDQCSKTTKKICEKPINIKKNYCQENKESSVTGFHLTDCISSFIEKERVQNSSETVSEALNNSLSLPVKDQVVGKTLELSINQQKGSTFSKNSFVNKTSEVAIAAQQPHSKDLINEECSEKNNLFKDTHIATTVNSEKKNINAVKVEHIPIIDPKSIIDIGTVNSNMSLFTNISNERNGFDKEITNEMITIAAEQKFLFQGENQLCGNRKREIIENGREILQSETKIKTSSILNINEDKRLISKTENKIKRNVISSLEDKDETILLQTDYPETPKILDSLANKNVSFKNVGENEKMEHTQSPTVSDLFNEGCTNKNSIGESQNLENRRYRLSCDLSITKDSSGAKHEENDKNKLKIKQMNSCELNLRSRDVVIENETQMQANIVNANEDNYQDNANKQEITNFANDEINHLAKSDKNLKTDDEHKQCTINKNPESFSLVLGDANFPSEAKKINDSKNSIDECIIEKVIEKASLIVDSEKLENAVEFLENNLRVKKSNVLQNKEKLMVNNTRKTDIAKNIDVEMNVINNATISNNVSSNSLFVLTDDVIKNKEERMKCEDRATTDFGKRNTNKIYNNCINSENTQTDNTINFEIADTKNKSQKEKSSENLSERVENKILKKQRSDNIKTSTICTKVNKIQNSQKHDDVKDRTAGIIEKNVKVQDANSNGISKKRCEHFQKEKFTAKLPHLKSKKDSDIYVREKLSEVSDNAAQNVESAKTKVSVKVKKEDKRELKKDNKTSISCKKNVSREEPTQNVETFNNMDISRKNDTICTKYRKDENKTPCKKIDISHKEIKSENLIKVEKFITAQENLVAKELKNKDSLKHAKNSLQIKQENKLKIEEINECKKETQKEAKGTKPTNKFNEKNNAEHIKNISEKEKIFKTDVNFSEEKKSTSRAEHERKDKPKNKNYVNKSPSNSDKMLSESKVTDTKLSTKSIQAIEKTKPDLFSLQLNSVTNKAKSYKEARLSNIKSNKIRLNENSISESFNKFKSKDQKLSNNPEAQSSAFNYKKKKVLDILTTSDVARKRRNDNILSVSTEPASKICKKNISSQPVADVKCSDSKNKLKDHDTLKKLQPDKLNNHSSPKKNKPHQNSLKVSKTDNSENSSNTVALEVPKPISNKIIRISDSKEKLDVYEFSDDDDGKYEIEDNKLNAVRKIFENKAKKEIKDPKDNEITQDMSATKIIQKEESKGIGPITYNEMAYILKCATETESSLNSLIINDQPDLSENFKPIESKRKKPSKQSKSKKHGSTKNQQSSKVANNPNETLTDEICPTKSSKASNNPNETLTEEICLTNSSKMSNNPNETLTENFKHLESKRSKPSKQSKSKKHGSTKNQQLNKMGNNPNETLTDEIYPAKSSKTSNNSNETLTDEICLTKTPLAAYNVTSSLDNIICDDKNTPIKFRMKRLSRSMDNTELSIVDSKTLNDTLKEKDILKNENSCPSKKSKENLNAMKFEPITNEIFEFKPNNKLLICDNEKKKGRCKKRKTTDNSELTQCSNNFDDVETESVSSKRSSDGEIKIYKRCTKKEKQHKNQINNRNTSRKRGRPKNEDTSSITTDDNVQSGNEINLTDDIELPKAKYIENNSNKKPKYEGNKEKNENINEVIEDKKIEKDAKNSIDDKTDFSFEKDLSEKEVKAVLQDVIELSTKMTKDHPIIKEEEVSMTILENKSNPHDKNEKEKALSAIFKRTLSNPPEKDLFANFNSDNSNLKRQSKKLKKCFIKLENFPKIEMKKLRDYHDNSYLNEHYSDEENNMKSVISSYNFNKLLNSNQVTENVITPETNSNVKVADVKKIAECQINLQSTINNQNTSAKKLISTVNSTHNSAENSTQFNNVSSSELTPPKRFQNNAPENELTPFNFANETTISNRLADSVHYSSIFPIDLDLFDAFDYYNIIPDDKNSAIHSTPDRQRANFLEKVVNEEDNTLIKVDLEFGSTAQNGNSNLFKINKHSEEKKTFSAKDKNTKETKDLKQSKDTKVSKLLNDTKDTSHLKYSTKDNKLKRSSNEKFVDIHLPKKIPQVNNTPTIRPIPTNFHNFQSSYERFATATGFQESSHKKKSDKLLSQQQNIIRPRVTTNKKPSSVVVSHEILSPTSPLHVPKNSTLVQQNQFFKADSLNLKSSTLSNKIYKHQSSGIFIVEKTSDVTNILPVINTKGTQSLDKTQL